ncbi:Lipoxygenase y domain-containing protein 1 [Desmophyllum pertusum]|uniref:Lipoxygenase y domain-containing protein 1 n=1 Tax=Desmophyllum pertusum TaxID=174260 RepID=A0A9X0DAZ0_9CNID|nr:Lipoxygenase y domain-containing protein 1 [Desmophyllum pertusum]
MIVTRFHKWCGFILVLLLCFERSTNGKENKKGIREVEIDKRSSTTVLYTVEVTTADVAWAGTNADVFIQIFGENSNTSTVRLTKSGTNLFERGHDDKFVFVDQAVKGRLTKVGIKRNDEGLWDDWKLDIVTVKPGGSYVYKFAFNEWIPANKWIYSYGG